MKISMVWLLAAFAWAQDSAATLARILESKGTISPAELTQVESAADRTKALADLLQQKGVLSASELARVGSGPAVSPSPAERSPTHLPVTFYGTLLFNAFYNDAAVNITDIPLFALKQGSDALGNDKTFGMTARQSRLGLRFDDPANLAGGKLMGDLEVDFLGGSAPFGNGVNMDLIRLRLAYGRLDWSHFALEAGQDWAVFAPLNPTS
jgi:hypothetical protein